MAVQGPSLTGDVISKTIAPGSNYPGPNAGGFGVPPASSIPYQGPSTTAPSHLGSWGTPGASSGWGFMDAGGNGFSAMPSGGAGGGAVSQPSFSTPMTSWNPFAPGAMSGFPSPSNGLNYNFNMPQGSPLAGTDWSFLGQGRPGVQSWIPSGQGVGPKIAGIIAPFMSGLGTLGGYQTPPQDIMPPPGSSPSRFPGWRAPRPMTGMSHAPAVGGMGGQQGMGDALRTSRMARRNPMNPFEGP